MSRRGWASAAERVLRGDQARMTKHVRSREGALADQAPRPRLGVAVQPGRPNKGLPRVLVALAVPDPEPSVSAAEAPSGSEVPAPRLVGDAMMAWLEDVQRCTKSRNLEYYVTMARAYNQRGRSGRWPEDGSPTLGHTPQPATWTPR